MRRPTILARIDARTRVFQQLPIDRGIADTIADAEPRMLAKYRRSLRFGRESKFSYIALGELAGYYMCQGRYEDVERIILRILAYLERRYGFIPHPDYPWWLHAWANVCRSLKRYDEAEAHSLEALALTQTILSDQQYDMSQLILRLADTYFERKEHGLAGAEYLRAIDELRRQEPSDPCRMADLHEKMAYVHWRARELNDADYSMREALRLRRATLHRNDAAIGRCHRWIAVSSLLTDRPARAVAHQRMALRIAISNGSHSERQLRREHFLMALFLRVFTGGMIDRGKLRASIPYYRRLLYHCDRMAGSPAELLNQWSSGYFRLLRERGMKAEAKELRAELDSVLKRARERLDREGGDQAADI